MKGAATVRREAAAALRMKGGWGASVGCWAIWVLLDSLMGKVPAFFASQPLVLAFLIVPLLYYFRFAKVYGTTALAVAVMRGGPTVRYAFAGFGRGWRAVMVHFWIVWRLLPVMLPGLVAFLSVGIWQFVDAARTAKGDTPLVQPFAYGLLLACLVLQMVLTLVSWYHYRLAYAVLVDHPDWLGRAVVEEARRLMAGSRRKMLLVDLGFIGMAAVVYLPGLYFLVDGIRQVDWMPMVESVRMATVVGGQDAVQSVAAALAPLARGILALSVSGLCFSLWIQPYWTTALAAFYEDLLDRAETSEPTPPEST